MIKKTALTDVHIGLGAKMVSFAGYQMPVTYSGINREHLSVRNNVGLFDVSHMGEFLIKGKGALELIQKVSSNDASKLVDGKVQYSYLPNSKGGIVDDLLIYRLKENVYLLVVNASNIKKDWDWISKHNKFSAEMEDISDKTTLLALQGPKAKQVLAKLTEIDIENMKYYTFEKGTVAGEENVLVSATGYTGSGGFELYFKNESADIIWKALFESGKEHEIKPIGLGARDTLRLEMGFCLYGNDIDETTSPIEAGLGWITKFTKKFIYCDELLKQKEIGIKNRLIGFELLDKGIPRKDYNIVCAEGKVIGIVTSGTMSPSLGKPIGLGYIRIGYAKPETEVFIEIRNKSVRAKVVKLPFYNSN